MSHNDSSVGKPNLIGYSLAYTFGEAMSQGIQGDVLLISNARGGGSQIRDWLRGESLYDAAAVIRANDADIRLSGSSLAGVVWYQGEGDSNNSDYAEDLQSVIDGLRSEFGGNDS